MPSTRPESRRNKVLRESRTRSASLKTKPLSTASGEQVCCLALLGGEWLSCEGLTVPCWEPVLRQKTLLSLRTLFVVERLLLCGNIAGDLWQFGGRKEIGRGGSLHAQMTDKVPSGARAV